MTEAQRKYREEYLTSDHWRTTRVGALERAAHRCQVCNGAKHLDVHHRTYERLGNERPEDLTVLCRKCHVLFHGVENGSRKPVARSGATAKKPPKQAKRKLEEERGRAILLILDDMGPAKTKEIAGRAELSIPDAGDALSRLQSKGEVRRIKNGGIWHLPLQLVVPPRSSGGRMRVENDRLHARQRESKQKRQILLNERISRCRVALSTGPATTRETAARAGLNFGAAGTTLATMQSLGAVTRPTREDSALWTLTDRKTSAGSPSRL